MGGKRIVNVLAPANASDTATKAYADSRRGSGVSDSGDLLLSIRKDYESTIGCDKIPWDSATKKIR